VDRCQGITRKGQPAQTGWPFRFWGPPSRPFRRHTARQWNRPGVDGPPLGPALRFRLFSSPMPIRPCGLRVRRPSAWFSGWIRGIRAPWRSHAKNGKFPPRRFPADSVSYIGFRPCNPSAPTRISASSCAIFSRI